MAFVALDAAAPAYAQAPVQVPPAAPAPPIAAPASLHVAAGTVVEIELVETVSSRIHKRGDKFAIRLATPIELDGKVLVPAGVTGVGEVVDAAAAGPLGRPAKLLLAARYLDFNGARIPLRAFKLGGAGKDNGNINIVGVLVPYALPLTMLVPGGQIEMPAGTRAQAKLAADVGPSDPPPPSPKDEGVP